MPDWRRAAPVQGWRIEIAEYHGHRLSVRGSRAGAYRAYMDGRAMGIWRSKEVAMAAAEWAAVAHSARPPARSLSKSAEPRNKQVR